MRYRRLGRTELLVSEVGLTARALAPLDPAVAGATLQAALDAGVSLIAFDASDAAEDVEPLIARVAGANRPRLTLVAVLDVLPPPTEVGPQVEAVAARLGVDGYLDVVAFPASPGPEHLVALHELAARGIARAWGIATSDATIARRSVDVGAAVLVAPLNQPRRAAMRLAFDHAAARDAGVILAGRLGSAPALDLADDDAGPALVRLGLTEAGVASVAAGPRTPDEARTLAEASTSAAAVDPAHAASAAGT